MSEEQKTWADAAATFRAKALVALATPTWCNNFYVQPYETKTVSIAFGSTQSFNSVGVGETYASSVVAGLLLDRAISISLCAFLTHMLAITPDELSEAVELHFPPVPPVAKP